MYWILIGALFLVPVYYRAKAIGYNGGVWAATAGCLGAGFFLISLITPSPIFTLLSFGVPAAFLAATFVIPIKANAPGEAYLTITFACPECGRTVSFPRRSEGDAELCPECGEIIRVPKDEFSPKPSSGNGGTTGDTKDEVCFETFGLPDQAHLLAAVLSHNGVPARVVSDDARPISYIAAVLGYRVMIDPAQWDEAAKIREQCQQDESTPSAGTAQT